MQKAIPLAGRLDRLPPYVFAELDQMVTEARREGSDVISFGIGDPDLPTPEPIVQALTEAVKDPATHRYSPYVGLPEFRRAAADWMAERFGVAVDPDREVVALIGSKEGIAHLPLATVDPGDVVLVPDPGYPVYHGAAILSGAQVVRYVLEAEDGYLPDLGALSGEDLDQARLLYLNYPHNPTGAVAGLDFYENVVAFAQRHELIVAADLAYAEMGFDGYQAPSILQVDGAREVAVEFHSLSKTFNMTGWRIGFAVGAEPVIRALARVKSNLDSGPVPFVQRAAVEALRRWKELAGPVRAVYRERQDMALAGLRALGIDVDAPQATFYLWAPVPGGGSSMDFVRSVLERTHVLFTPGLGFGQHGEGYFRLALTLPSARIEEAFDRLAA